MALDAWLPIGFKLPDGAKVRTALFGGVDWQRSSTIGFTAFLPPTRFADCFGRPRTPRGGLPPSLSPYPPSSWVSIRRSPARRARFHGVDEGWPGPRSRSPPQPPRRPRTEATARRPSCSRASPTRRAARATRTTRRSRRTISTRCCCTSSGTRWGWRIRHSMAPAR